MSDAAIIADCLGYQERKALRRIARNKSAKRTVAAKLEELGLAERVWGMSWQWCATRLGAAVEAVLQKVASEVPK